MLINRAHTHTDIYLPIDEQEKRMFDRIDGVHTIREIVGGGAHDHGRSLFERLWWHDQIVLDASKASSR